MLSDNHNLNLDALNDQINKNRFRWGQNNAQSTTNRIQRQLRPVYVFLYQFGMGCVWIYKKIINPCISPFRKAIKKCWHWYRLLWDRIVYNTDEYHVRYFVKWRAGTLILATVAMIGYGIPIGIGFLWDSGLYILTSQRNEVLYLHRAQEIVPHENIFAISGCDVLPCSDQESMYFRVRSNLFNQLWSWIHHYSIFYPDFVAGAVPDVVSKCVVTTYGIRKKLFIRGLEIYPDLIEVKSCSPTTFTVQ